MNAQSKVEAPTLAKLREPFPANQISKLPKPLAKREIMDALPKAKCKVCGNYHATDKIIHLDYVGHAAATDRLLDTDLEWSWEPFALTPEGLPAFDRNGGLWIKLTVLGVTRPGYGSADGKDGGNAVKEIIGDAIRNAGMRFGMALDLWHKGDLHADEDDAQQQPEPEAPSEMPDAEWAKLVSLIEATSANTTAMLKHYEVKSLRHLNQDQYSHALKSLNAKLAKLAKDETNAKAATLAEELADEIVF
jgi:hypothetical protein